MGFNLFILGLYLSYVLIYWFALPVKWRPASLLAASIIFVSRFGFYSTVYFLINILIVYASGVVIDTQRCRKKIIGVSILAWLICNICFFKYGSGFLRANYGANVYFPVGMSYIIFRMIHYIIEKYRGNIPRSDGINFASYVLFFPTFLAGPVDRFNRFRDQSAAAASFDLGEIQYGLFRILKGMVKKFVIADWLAMLLVPIFALPQYYSRVVVLMAIYCLAVRIYLDFSGYTDIALGLARLFGYRIMENFDRPFLKKNIALFWRSWHISVYGWIRDYFFFPLFGWRAATIKLYVGIFISMVVFMLWHRGSLSFLILGIYHGLGLIAWQLFQEIKMKYPTIRKIFLPACLNPIAVFCTFTFVSIGFVFFSFEAARAVDILKRLFIL